MNTIEALHVLEQVRQKFTGSGADHDAIREALRVVTEACQNQCNCKEVTEFPKNVED